MSEVLEPGTGKVGVGTDDVKELFDQLVGMGFDGLLIVGHKKGEGYTVANLGMNTEQLIYSAELVKSKFMENAWK